jgi:hypothetical protein
MIIDDVILLAWATARITPRVAADLAVLRRARALAHRALQAEIAGEAEVPLATALILVDTIAEAVGGDHPWTMAQFDAVVRNLVTGEVVGVRVDC